MTRFLFDTGIASDFINRRHGVFNRAKQELAAGHRIGIAMPVLAELLFGIELSASRDRNLQRLQSAFAYLIRWPFDEDAAKHYGRLAADLRRRGRPMQQIDIMVAAIALTLGDCVVVTRDSDLSAISEIRVENWAVPSEASRKS